MAVDVTAFREAMAHHAAAVAIVTCRTPDGRFAGLTATSVTSLSLSPPRLLVCVATSCLAHAAIVGSEQFMVCLLNAGHAGFAAEFATAGALRFALPGIEILEDGLAGVRDSVARFVCRTANVYRDGDHSIVVGEVDRLSVNGGDVLIYHRRRYGVVQSTQPDLVR